MDGMDTVSAVSIGIYLLYKLYKLAAPTSQDPNRRIDDLNYDTLFHIFEYLKTDWRSLINASKVCRAWHAAAYDKRLWKDFVIDFTDQRHRSISDEIAHSMRDRDIRSIRLSLEDDSEPMIRNFHIIAETIETKMLIISSLVALDYITMKLPLSFSSLRSLSVSHLGVHLITPAGLDRLFSPLCNLEQLHVGWAAQTQGERDRRTVRYHRRLYRKDPHFGSNYFESVFYHLPKLKDLSVHDYGRCYGFDFDFSVIFPNNSFPNLERLFIHYSAIDIEDIVRMVPARVFPNLRHLAFRSGVIVINTHMYPTLTHDHKKLESFRASSIAYTHWLITNIHHVAEVSKHLTSLDISLPTQQSANYQRRQLVISNMEVGTILTNLPGLKMFNVFGHKLGIESFNENWECLMAMEVLILGPIKWKNLTKNDEKKHFIDNIRERWTNLYSVLGVLFDNQVYSHLCNLRYVWDWDGVEKMARWDEKVVKLKYDRIKQWYTTPVSRGTKEWRKAVGFQFQNLPESFLFNNVQLT